MNEEQRLNLTRMIKEYDADDNTEKISSLINSFPKDQGWRRQRYEVSKDLHFLDPVSRALDDKIWSNDGDKKAKLSQNSNKSGESKEEINNNWERNKKLVLINGRLILD